MSQQDRPQEGVSENVDLYQKRVKAYYDQRNNVKPHKFEVGGCCLESKFGAVRHVIVEFKGKDTCKIVNTVNGKTYVRNVKHLTHAPMDSRTLFDDKESQQIVADSSDKETTG